MALPITVNDASKLVHSLDFETKGLGSPILVSHSRDGKDARLVVKAIYKGPRAGWPLLDRKKIYDIALKTSDNKDGNTATASVLGNGTDTDTANRNNVPICVADIDVAYPVPVIIRIALISQPGACDDMLKVGRAYSQLYANDYLPFELPLAVWRTAEGIWSVAMDESPVSLMDWWEQNVQPQIHASESRWKIGSWRRKSEDHDVEASDSITAQLRHRHREEQQEQKKRILFLDEASREINGLIEEKAELAQNETDSSAEKVRSEQEKVADSMSKKSEKMIAGDKSDARPSADGDDEGEISDSRKQEWAARIQRHQQDIHKSKPSTMATEPEQVPSNVAPVAKQIGVDEDEEETMIIDKGWLQAVNILIQLADIVLSLHERRLCMVVCRPDFFTVFESRPFISRSGIPSGVQSISLQLIHLGIVVQMPGYDGGKLVGHMNTDFDGDKVLAMGAGSASAFTNFGSTATAGNEEAWMVGEDEGVGALRGVLDEASILRHLQYIAPEAISSNKAIASTVDIFSWGMTAYELLKGRGQGGTESDDSKAEFFRAIHLHSTRAMPTLTSLCPSMPPELSALIKKALALDPDDRYSNFCALLHDLHKVKQICDGTLRGSARRDFIVGHIDYQSRFAIPPALLDREEEYGMLDQAYRLVKTTGQSQVACCWGVSGSGKSKLLETWARRKEADNAGQDCFVSWAKMDQHLVKPLSAFISVFCSLLERVFSDPLESASDWRQKILDSLAVNANIFLALLPKEWRAILLDGQVSDEMDSDMTAGIDWESWVKQFRTWSYGLLRLFASEARPLLVIIDDVQWLEKSERELWEELITSETRRLDHCLILFSYRTQHDAPPDISPFVPKYMIQARFFSEATLANMIHRCFHLEDVAPTLPEQWTQLCSYLYKNTKGNPFDLKWTLSTLVRDGDIYYDYVAQEWNIRTAVLNAYPDLSAEDFAASVLNSLSQQARVVLCHLACLPSRGVEIALLAHIVNKTENTVRALLDECATLGSIVVRNTKVQFVHDKPHTAALGLIDPQEKPRLFAKIARNLDGLSTDYNFVRADMLLSAYHSDPELLEPLEVVKAAVRAARQAAASAALDLASSYVNQACDLWSYGTAQAWETDPDLTMDLVTVTAEVALGRRTAASRVDNIIRARDSASKLYTKLDISLWIFKLQLSASRPDLAMKSFFEAIRLLGYDTPAETQRYPPPPSDETEIRNIANSPLPPDTEEAKVAISLQVDPCLSCDLRIDPKLCFFASFPSGLSRSNLVGTAGPSFYSYEADKGWRIMHFVIPIYLHNHAATKHSATAYSWYVMAILLANGEVEYLGRARAYIDLGDSYNLIGSPLEAIAETAKVTLGYIRTTSLKTIDYSRSYQVCFATKNYDVLSYTLGLDLSAQALSGHSVAELYTAGRNTMTTLADDLQPAIRLMAVPFIEFGAHLMNVSLIETKSDFSALNVLEGEYVTPQDAEDLSNRAAFYAVVYAIASLFLGLLFKASPEELRKRATLVEANQQGGSGTILGTFCFIILSITTLVLDDLTDQNVLEQTYSWLYALPHSEDFQSSIRMLKALETIKAVRCGDGHWREMMDSVEEAIEALENARSYLFTGLLCVQAEQALHNRSHTTRVRRDFLSHAQLAFKACEAQNLVLFVDVLLAKLPQSRLIIKRDERNSVTESSTIALSEGFLSHDVASANGSEEVHNSNGREADPQKQKLGLESILRSFLILASERDSDGLIRRVLQVLLQVTCTNYACFATQDPATGSLKLKGYGTYDDIKICDITIAEAKEIAPTVLLSHCSITKKPINAANISSSVNANLLRREPFFASTGPPKTLLTLPLFVQGRFSGLLFLSGKVSNGHPSTSQVGLLATFAAIILESNQAYATLESAVEMRTQQLQHALHSRSTFISGVSHEIRTPLFAITGLCSVMEASADLTSAQRENLQVISQSADDLQRIVTAVLDWSKLDARSITPESIPFDLRNVIENALETVAHLARSKNIHLLLENPVSTDPPMPLLGDPHRYRQCLLNLLSNAIKFTKSTTPGQYSIVSVSWSWQDHPDKVEITCAVKDEGIGIPAKSMHRLFHSFSQVDSGISRNFGGTGLGLSITRGLARLLGGDCWAESVEGQGSTFYLLVAAAKSPGPDAELPMAYPRGPSRQAVLYAPACLASSVLQANLQEFGINATLASIEESNLRAAPDFVFVDADEPTINSEVLQTLRGRHEGSKFVFLVTLTDVSKLVNSLALNQEAIVTKPLKAQSLYNTTKNLDASSSGSSSKAAKKASTMDSSYAKKYPLKICYIDDSSVNVAVGKKILSKFGYKNIDVCYDGNQAVEAAERTKYDLMLMDLQMPNMDGHTARKLISENEKCGNPMVVALTANCDQPTKDRCLREGFADFLTKPLIISDLAKLLIEAYEVRNNNGV